MDQEKQEASGYHPSLSDAQSHHKPHHEHPSANKKSLLIPLTLLFVVLAGVLSYLLFGRSSTDTQPTLLQNTVTQPKRIGIIRYLKVMDEAMAGFKKGMADLGYVEGRDVVYEDQLADGNIPKVDEIARNFLNQNVDMIFAISSVAGRGALKESTMSGKISIPIVYTFSDNPVLTGLAKSLTSSGNNATGVAVSHAEIVAKRLEFLQKINPEAKRLGLFVAKASDPAANFVMQELKVQAPRFGMEIVEYKLENPPGPLSIAEFKKVAQQIKVGDIDAIFHTPGPVVNLDDNVATLIDLQIRVKVPMIAVNPGLVPRGALFTYAHDVYEMGRQSATMADKVFKGTKPSDIPIEFPKKNSLVINLKTAAAIGITIPESMLTIADKTIE